MTKIQLQNLKNYFFIPSLRDILLKSSGVDAKTFLLTDLRSWLEDFSSLTSCLMTTGAMYSSSNVSLGCRAPSCASEIEMKTEDITNLFSFH